MIPFLAHRAPVQTPPAGYVPSRVLFDETTTWDVSQLATGPYQSLTLAMRFRGTLASGHYAALVGMGMADTTIAQGVGWLPNGLGGNFGGAFFFPAPAGNTDQLWHSILLTVSRGGALAGGNTVHLQVSRDGGGWQSVVNDARALPDTMRAPGIFPTTSAGEIEGFFWFADAILEDPLAFFTATGAPRDLGQSGSGGVVSGVTPLVYTEGNAAFWNGIGNNFGTAGDIGVIGAVADAV